MRPAGPHLQLNDVLSLLGQRSAQFRHVEYPLLLLVHGGFTCRGGIALPILENPEALDVPLQCQVDIVPRLPKVDQRCALVPCFEFGCRGLELCEICVTGRRHFRGFLQFCRAVPACAAGGLGLHRCVPVGVQGGLRLLVDFAISLGCISQGRRQPLPFPRARLQIEPHVVGGHRKLPGSIGGRREVARRRRRVIGRDRHRGFHLGGPLQNFVLINRHGLRLAHVGSSSLVLQPLSSLKWQVPAPKIFGRPRACRHCSTLAGPSGSDSRPAGKPAGSATPDAAGC
ncbi:hypothetical protein LAUMK35_00093 [Mycobacterium pseudokansasii]|nr:hypothetical protein LAUMK35_00093 [Mycobacterium pseudokansasii]VAZ87536.1 hypothetical protein LAUMK21_00091 [Mycobacterium pseudokansasii]